MARIKETRSQREQGREGKQEGGNPAGRNVGGGNVEGGQERGGGRSSGVLTQEDLNTLSDDDLRRRAREQGLDNAESGDRNELIRQLRDR